MVTPLNLYATKVFAEQPLGLWALDDKADYISFLDPLDQDLSLWSGVGIDSVVDATDSEEFNVTPAGIPFPETVVNGIIASSSNEGLVSFTSPFQLQPENLNLNQETFSFGFYLYSFSKILNLRLGFRYTNSATQEVEEVIKSATISPTLAWAAVSETFKIPEDFEDLELIIEASYRDDQETYEFVINAITAGQWAEEFQLKSFGVNLINVPSNISIPITQGIEAKPYGFPTNSGYYLAEDNSLSARNLGLPLVFGSRNSTYIKPKTGSPSLIIPGLGFLNKTGQFNRLTAEFWIKINSNATVPKKIFGPISSDDGLYVDGPFLRLKIGQGLASHYVKEWNRPMLIDITLSSRKSTLIVNGEDVGSIDLDPKSYSFPNATGQNLQQDWLGFYAYEDVPSLQVDCVAIYPYEVPTVVSKRRWVYGQGVKPPTNIKGLDSSSSVFVDYPFSKYSRNYYFPASSKWSNGSTENVLMEKDIITVPAHELPEVRFSNKNRNEWLEDLKNFQNNEIPLITMRPGNSWEETESHIFFKNLNFLETQTKCFYGVFESRSPVEEKETLFEITNTINSNSLKIYTKGDVLSYADAKVKKIQAPSGFAKYSIKDFPHAFTNESLIKVLDSSLISEVPSASATEKIYSVVNIINETDFDIQIETGTNQNVGSQNFQIDEDLKIIHESTIYYTFSTKQPNGLTVEKIFYETPGQKINQRFFVGLDIPRFVRAQGKELSTFLGTRQRLLTYVAGTQALQETFGGNIHRVGFCTDRNLNKIKHLFSEEGVPVDYVNVFNNFGPTAFDAGGEYFENDLYPDGNAISPPPAFWSLVLDGGDPYDFATITAEEHIASYTLLPKQQFEKFDIDIAVDSYWEDYVPLSYFSKNVPDARGDNRPEVTFIQFNLDYPVINKFINNKYDTSKSIVRSYVSFQYLQNGSNSTSSNFINKESLDKTKIVRPGSNWMNTKYEVVDGTIIYPPSDIDISNISINVYLEFVVDGIKANPVNIRSLQLSSQSYGYSPNKIGTKFGTDLVPFSRSNQYFNYKNAPALSIYKGSTPYFYNTSNSGIELKVPYSNINNQGLSMPINKLAAEFFKIGSMQMSLKYGEELFPELPTKIFEIAYKDESISFFLVADSPSRERGQVYAVNDNTNRIQGGLVFFSNGVPVKRPVLYSNSWTVLGMSFPEFLDFGEFPGALRITSPIMFNNISYFQTTRADDEERFGFRQWFAVRTQLGEFLDWGYWAGKEVVGETVETIPDAGFIWQDVLFLSTIVREEIDASTIYNIFTGTERIVVEGDESLPIAKYQYSIFKDIAWSSNISNPV